MPRSRSLAWSSVARKALAAISGLALFLFVIAHLLGNLSLFSGDPDDFNAYSHLLTSNEVFLYTAELGLLAMLALHLFTSVRVRLDQRRTRPVGYAVRGDAGGPSRKGLASRSMLVTGLVVLVFTGIHLKTFKYGPEYTTEIHGESVRDLHQLVVEVFQNEWYVIGYVATMLFLGLHLRHAFWSAFDSLGARHPRYSKLIYSAALVLAFAIAAGYLIIPVWIYATY